MINVYRNIYRNLVVPLMKRIKTCVQFIGGIYLAIGLIIATALVVMLGTVIEAITKSHLHASTYTYQSPLFSLLLSLFFVNILCASIRRWPFRRHHIPFLMTHFGLLLLISGTLIKNHYGVQGNMILSEGGSAKEIFIPNSYAIHIEKRFSDVSKKKHQLYPLASLCVGTEIHPLESPFHELTLKIISSTPHVSENFETWIKGKEGIITGFPPFPVYSWDAPPKALPTSSSLRLAPSEMDWKIIAVRTPTIQETFIHHFIQSTTLTLSEKYSDKERISVDLEKAIGNPIIFRSGEAKVSLQCKPDAEYSLIIDWSSKDSHSKETIYVPLTGNNSLKPLLLSHPHLLSPSFDVDLTRSPSLLMIQDLKNNLTLYAIDQYGRIHHKSYPQWDLKSVYMYDGGFGGYAVEAVFPYYSFSAGREAQERADQLWLARQLRSDVEKQNSLLPPLLLLKEACTKSGDDFAETFFSFLTRWSHSARILFPNEDRSIPALSQIEWDSIGVRELQKCLWTEKLFTQLEKPLEESQDLLQLLRKKNWPLLSPLEQSRQKNNPCTPEEVSSLLTLLAQQIFRSPIALPKLPMECQSGRLLSVYLKSYGIDPSFMTNTLLEIPQLDRLRTLTDIPNNGQVIIESPLIFKYQPEEPSLTWENNRPGITLEIARGNQKELISLAYSSPSFGPKMAIFQGEYLINFQPIVREIPYQIQLQSAKQENYPGSSLPRSYECDILISSKNGEDSKKTLSMNQAYESIDGYRFCLTGLANRSEIPTKQVQIVVSYDPVKYVLTYPGICFLIFGIPLLTKRNRFLSKIS